MWISNQVVINVILFDIAATGEPSLVLSYVIILALRCVLESAQKDAGIAESYFHLGAPCTPDVIFLNSGIDVDQFKLIDK